MKYTLNSHTEIDKNKWKPVEIYKIIKRWFVYSLVDYSVLYSTNTLLCRISNTPILPMIRAKSHDFSCNQHRNEKKNINRERERMDT